MLQYEKARIREVLIYVGLILALEEMDNMLHEHVYVDIETGSNGRGRNYVFKSVYKHNYTDNHPVYKKEDVKDIIKTLKP